MKQNCLWLRQLTSFSLALAILASPVAQAVQGLPVRSGETDPAILPVETTAGTIDGAEDPGNTGSTDYIPAQQPEREPVEEDSGVQGEVVESSAPETALVPERPVVGGQAAETEEPEPLEPMKALNVSAIEGGYGNGASGSSFGLPMPDGSLGSYFRVETDIADAWAYSVSDILPVTEGDEIPFYILPNGGRVPDQELEGWYYFTQETEESYTNWTYTDALTKKLPVLDQDTYDSLKDTMVLAWKDDPDEGWVRETAPFGELYPEETTVGSFWTGLLTTDSDTPESALRGTTLRVVARWVDSSVSDVRTFELLEKGSKGSPLTLYGEDLAKGGLQEKDLTPVTLDPAGGDQEFYARVAPDVDLLSLTMKTFEPYLQYHLDLEKGLNEAAPVQVTLCAAGQSETTSIPLDYKIPPEVAAGQRDVGGGAFLYEPKNDLGNPACAQWTTQQIPLTLSAGAGNYYNDIIVTITAPDGEHSSTYTFHVQRLRDPVVQQAYGNTPTGMIEREPLYDETTQQGMTEEQKEYLRTQWDSERSIYSERYPLRGENNNSGAIYRGVYPNAQKAGATDYDSDCYAIVAYQNTAFLDPGFTLVDSQGDTVSFGADAEGDDRFDQAVERRLVLRQTDMLIPSQLKDGAGTKVYYSNHALADQETTEALRSATDVVDLRGLSVLPGIYELEYIYQDPYTGKRYSSDAADRTHFLEAKYAPLFRRTLVVLPKPGDINMDGVVNIDDIQTMSRSWRAGASGVFAGNVIAQNVVTALVTARVMDLDHDGVISGGDVDILKSGFLPSLEVDCNYYYLPLPDGETTHAERAKLTAAEEPVEGLAQMTLEFLGTNVDGPNLAPSANTKVDLYDLFWVGIRLTNVPADSPLSQEVEALTLTLTYNSRYLRPADRLEENCRTFANAELDEEEWREILKTANLVNGARTVWSGTGMNYQVLKGSDNSSDLGAYAARKPVYDLTRPVTPMEQKVDERWLQELTLPIYNAGSKNANLQSGGYLLLVPFYLKDYPRSEGEIPPLLELAVGGRELALATKTGTASYAGVAFDAVDGSTLVAGGSHINLRNALCFPKGLVLDLPMGEDTAAPIALYNNNIENVNAVYGEEFVNMGVLPFSNVAIPVEGLPPGLTYDSVQRRLSGIPSRAGTYDFVVMERVYRVVVQKAPLHIFADRKGRYYGEVNLYNEHDDTKGDASYTFRYWPEDLKALDKDRAGQTYTAPDGTTGTIVDDGRGVNLPALLGLYDGALRVEYTAPELVCYEDPDAAVPKEVSRTTDSGVYAIQLGNEPETTNYTIIYTKETGETYYSRTVATLEIYARPVVIWSFRPDYIVNQYRIFYNDVGRNLNGLSATKTSSQTPAAAPFQLVVASTAGGSGTVGGMEVTGEALVRDTDALRVTFNVEFVQEPQDVVLGTTTTKFFSLSQAVERRRVLVNDVSLDYTYGDAAKGNYRIYGFSAEQIEAQGVVTRRAISRLEITREPKLEYTYGSNSSVDADSALQIRIYSGFGNGIRPGNPTVYNRDYFQADGLRVRWVTPEEKALAEEYLAEDDAEGLLYYLQDMEEEETQGTGAGFGLPFGTGDSFPLTVNQHDGRILCIWTASNDEDGDDVAVVTFGSGPLVIHPGQLTLRVQHTARYYGEPNPQAVFIYDPQELTRWDANGLTLTGDGAELEDLVFTAERGFRYTPPTVEVLTALDGGGTLVDERTPAHESQYRFITLKGAALEGGNYRFRYVCEATPTAGQSGQTTYSDTMGYGTLLIRPRRVVLQEVYSSADAPLITLYADTGEQSVTPDTTAPDGSKMLAPVPLTWTAAEGGLDQGGRKQGFTLSIPQGATADSNTYYPRNGVVAVTEPMGYQNLDALILGPEGQLPDLSLTFTATAIPDRHSWATDLTENYYDMQDAVNGQKDYRCQIADVRLAGADAGNYQLVFDRPDDAERGMPYQREYVTENYSDISIPKNMYSAGHAKVLLRPIRKIEIVATPKMEYTYGDPFSPDYKASTNGSPLKVRIDYDTRYDNAPRRNLSYEEVEFQMDSGTDTFAARGLQIYYLPQGESLETSDPMAQGWTLPVETPLLVSTHHGARLVVVGQRDGMADPVWSDASDLSLIVHKRTLPLTAVDQHRYYGEDNETYEFTFHADDLAEIDRRTLASQGISGQITGSTGGCAALAILDPGAKMPSFQTQAVPGSDVLNAGYSGYALDLSGGSMTNYVFSYESGTIYVYRRPVTIDSFTGGPIYTVFSDMSARVFSTNVSNVDHTPNPFPQDQSPDCIVHFALPGAGDYENTADPALNAQVGQSLPLTKSAVYRPGDELNLSVQVHFLHVGQDTNWDTVAADQTVQVQQAVLTRQAASGYNNYYLVDEGQTLAIEATGLIKLRDINGIQIIQTPTSLDYTYGQTLDMSRLRVRITYQQGSTEVGNNYVDVDYTGPDKFAEYGLYLNYYDKSTPPASQEDRAALVERGRKADTGDHLTIAPTHDGSGFSHHGKYLVVSARLNDQLDYMAPQMVNLRGDGRNEGTPITVRPLALTYTLDPAEKTYDGDTAAAGTLTLTNAFNQRTQLVYGREATVIDRVYIATGADYESAAQMGNYNGLDAYLAANGHAYTTGVYAETPYENGLTYNSGYDRATQLNFTFTDPNVAYAAQPDLDSHTWGELAPVTVETTNLVLRGPDATNYTLDTAVTAASLAAGRSRGYQGTGLPDAVIHKADRTPLPEAARPQVERDAQTNVLRIVYNDRQATAQVADPGDQKTAPGDLHIEYALQSVTEDATPALIHVAANSGTEYFQDRIYFGGEFEDVWPEWPEDYVPEDSKTSRPEGDSAKGQTYPWAEEDVEVSLGSYPAAGENYPGFDVYHSQRDPLERDTVYWALVRVAETWNYKPSSVLSSAEEIDSALADSVVDALAAVAAAEAAGRPGDPGAQAAQAVLDFQTARLKTAAEAGMTAARDRAAEEAEALLAEGGGAPAADGQSPTAPMVKTYLQRLDLVSLSEETGRVVPGQPQTEKFSVPTLEAVWFTDALRYENEDQLDAVARNENPKRYYGYYWDPDMSAEAFPEEGDVIDLTGPFQVTYTPKTEDGQEGPQRQMTVNEDHTARLYVDAARRGGGGVMETGITISPAEVSGHLGADPVQLTVTFEPSYVTIRQIVWTSSDETVATVDRKGLVTFVGVGECTITATSFYGREDSITVTVRAATPQDERFPLSVLRFDATEPLFQLDDLRFYPERTMTRGELVMLLAGLYRDNPDRPLDEEAIHFADVGEDSPWRDAVDVLSRAGVVTGIEGGMFAGDRTATRAEMITMLARMIWPDPPPGDPDGPHAFEDTGPADTWAWAYVDFLTQQDVIRGVGGGQFAPNRVLTRAEAAAFLARLLDEGDLRWEREDYTRIPVDVPVNYWSCVDIRWSVNRRDIPAFPEES